MPEQLVKTERDYTYRIKRGYTAAVRDCIRAACFKVEAAAKQNITDQDAVDTGALRASVYTNVEGLNGYSKAVAEAQACAQRPGRKSGRSRTNFRMLPPVGAGPMEGIVGVGAEYGAYVEYGTVFTRPRPFFERAAENVMRDFEEKLTDAINREVS